MEVTLLLCQQHTSSPRHQTTVDEVELGTEFAHQYGTETRGKGTSLGTSAVFGRNKKLGATSSGTKNWFQPDRVTKLFSEKQDHDTPKISKKPEKVHILIT